VHDGSNSVNMSLGLVAPDIDFGLVATTNQGGKAADRGREAGVTAR
jgi:hypothetical protein